MAECAWRALPAFVATAPLCADAHRLRYSTAVLGIGAMVRWPHSARHCLGIRGIGAVTGIQHRGIAPHMRVSMRHCGPSGLPRAPPRSPLDRQRRETYVIRIAINDFNYRYLLGGDVDLLGGMWMCSSISHDKVRRQFQIFASAYRDTGTAMGFGCQQCCLCCNAPGSEG